MEYKGYTIEILVVPNVRNAVRYSGSYKIFYENALATSGIVKGGLKTLDDAYRAAQNAAYHWIDGIGDQDP